MGYKALSMRLQVGACSSWGDQTYKKFVIVVGCFIRFRPYPGSLFYCCANKFRMSAAFWNDQRGSKTSSFVGDYFALFPYYKIQKIIAKLAESKPQNSVFSANSPTDSFFICVTWKPLANQNQLSRNKNYILPQIHIPKRYYAPIGAQCLFFCIWVQFIIIGIFEQVWDLQVTIIIRMKLNKLTNRIMYLSPTVQAGWETESYKTDFQNLANLGQGSYGVVWKGKHKKTGTIYAIKEIKKKTLTSQSLIDHVRNQVKIMYELKHPNIINLYNHFEDDFSIYFVLEFAQKGQLFKALVKSPNKKFDELQAAKYVYQVATAIQYIHKKNIIHRDIKPENILIGKDEEVKLADFGWSNFTVDKNKRQTYCGTLDYLAPEMIVKGHLHDYRVDIWSLGVLIYQLCTGASPFSSELNSKVKVTEQDIKKNISSLNYKLPKELSQECRDLISKILVLDPEKRPSIIEIINHAWIRKIHPQQQAELQQNDKWQSKLKQQFGVVLDTKEEDIKKYEVFSNQEIYKNSRIESVINANKPKGDFKDRKVEMLDLRVKQLQKINKWQEEELKYLRKIKEQHQKCSKELSNMNEINKQANRKIEIMRVELEEYQRRLKELQKTSNR